MSWIATSGWFSWQSTSPSGWVGTSLLVKFQENLVFRHPHSFIQSSVDIQQIECMHQWYMCNIKYDPLYMCTCTCMYICCRIDIWEEHLLCYIQVYTSSNVQCTCRYKVYACTCTCTYAQTAIILSLCVRTCVCAGGQ